MAKVAIVTTVWPLRRHIPQVSGAESFSACGAGRAVKRSPVIDQYELHNGDPRLPCGRCAIREIVAR